MSRYFKYKSSESLLADARGLGLDFHLNDDLSPLLQPATVGGRLVGNRLAIQPMEGCDAELDGSPGELTFRRFRRFGAGGAKLIWGEACAVVPEGRANPRQLVINERNLDALSRLVQLARTAQTAYWVPLRDDRKDQSPYAHVGGMVPGSCVGVGVSVGDDAQAHFGILAD